MLRSRRLVVATLAVAVSLFETVRLAEAQSEQPRVRAPRFRTVSVGQDFSCGLTPNDGEALCWGGNYYGQLGTRSAPGLAPCPRHLDIVSTCARLPVPVGTRRFTDLAAGIKHACAVGGDSTVWCWGRNESGQLGAATSATCSPNPKARGMEEFAPSACSMEPVQVASLPPARLVAAGDDFSCALTAEEGAIYCWGGGAGTTPRRLSDHTKFRRISAGYTNVCADGDDARVACWSLYLKVSDPEWSSVADGLYRVATNSHTCAIGGPANTVYCWGYNADGSLGKGSHSAREDVNTPVAVAGNRKFVQVAVSFLGTCAVEATVGELFCWGSAPGAPKPDRCASGGEFGGYSKCALTPQSVFPRWNFGTVAISGSHGCATAAGNAYCWGSNNFGELGNGTTDNEAKVPQLVGVQAPGGRLSRLSFPAPSGRTLVLVGILGFLAFLGVRILRSPSR